jgi:acyl-CoA reductase-like NAD-dependent aldehyde dehydrogenase
MTQHPGIAKISFTGSTRTGKLVAASCAKTIKRVTLELGGKDPAVICANVNIPAVAAQVATFAFLNSGQICLAVKRIYIHKSIYNEFRQALVDHVKTLNVGSGLDSNTFCGPIQNDMQFGIVSTYFDDIEKEKWTVAVGGEKPEQKEKSGGYYIKPTIIDNPPEESRIVQEEPFGPILPILSWENEDEVIDRANGLDLGLGASVWSDDLEQAERIARKIESGTVWVNKVCLQLCVQSAKLTLDEAFRHGPKIPIWGTQTIWSGR